MFRPMRRIKQQLAEDEALEVLKSAKRGVLSVIGDDGWPYGIHLNPYWEDGRLYFHGAKAGHKIDALRRDSRASFTVIDDGGEHGLGSREGAAAGLRRLLRGREDQGLPQGRWRL